MIFYLSLPHYLPLVVLDSGHHCILAVVAAAAQCCILFPSWTMDRSIHSRACVLAPHPPTALNLHSQEQLQGTHKSPGAVQYNFSYGAAESSSKALLSLYVKIVKTLRDFTTSMLLIQQHVICALSVHSTEKYTDYIIYRDYVFKYFVFCLVG